MWQAAQGDILFTRVSKLPKQVTSVSTEDGRVVFARGEATGHHHSATMETCTLSTDEGGVMYCTVEELTEVTHQEHGTVVLEPGIYRVDKQQELNSWKGWRQVVD